MEPYAPLESDPRYKLLVHSLQTGQPVHVNDGIIFNVREVDPGWNNTSENNDDE